MNQTFIMLFIIIGVLFLFTAIANLTLNDIKDTIMERIEALSLKLDEFLAKNDAYIAQIKRDVAAEVEAAVAAAVAADDSAESPAIIVLGEKIQAATDRVQPPVFEPSNQ